MLTSLRLTPLLGLLCFASITPCFADSVRLQINGPDGKPIAGAKVRVVEANARTYRNQDFSVRDFVSDAQGAISLESKETLAKDAQNQNMAFLVARVLAPGLAASALVLRGGDNALALEQGQTLEGVVLDGSEKPVANVHLAVNSLPNRVKTDNAFERMLASLRLPDALALEVTSDAQGHWKVESMPRTGEARIEVQDARFKREGFPLDLSQQPPPLFVSPGATLKGRMLRPDGTGAAGVKIYAGDYGKQPVTDGQGRFEATGIGDDSLVLQIIGNDQKLPFIVGYKQVDGLTPGETLDVGDWKTTKGVTLKGRVVDTTTKKPIEGASVSMWARATNASAKTDNSGAFEVLVSPDISNLTIRASGFAAFGAGSVADPKNGLIDMGTIELRPGYKVSGAVVDEDGNPVGSISLYVDQKDGNREYARSALQNGTFSFEGLENGKFTVVANGQEIVSGATFSIEAGKAPVLRVIVKGKGGKAQEQEGRAAEHTLEGRVVDEEGHPIAGAKIALSPQENRGNIVSGAPLLSQTDGTFKIVAPIGVSALRVSSVIRPGFVRGTEKIEEKDGNWRVEMTLQKRGKPLQGRVVDAAGLPVVGAYVGLQNGADLPLITDKNGAFSLPEAPQVGVSLLASNGSSLATFAVEKAGAPIEISLPAEASIEDKEALADQILPKASLGYDWKGRWNALGSKRIGEMILRRRAEGDGVWNWYWTAYLQELARREPQTLLAREDELRARTPADALPELERLAMGARANSKDAAQKEKARLWLQTQANEKRDISTATVTRLLGLAQVGMGLDAKEGAMWLDYAAQIASQLDSKNTGRYSGEWGALAAGVSPTAIETVGEEWSATVQLQAFFGAMQTWVADGNVEAARGGWEKMQGLALDAIEHPEPTVATEGFHQKPSDILNQARNQYAGLLARTDPQAALTLIDPPATASKTGTLKPAELLNAGRDDYQKVETLLVIEREAARQKQFDVAREAALGITDTLISSTEFVANAAGILQQFNAPFADQLWRRAYAKGRPRDENEGADWQPSLAAYAQERAKLSPGQSRILIEREWAKRLLRSTKPNGENFAPNELDPNARAMMALAVAMTHLNPRRALEMVEQIPDKENGRAQARGSIAIALLSK